MPVLPGLLAQLPSGLWHTAEVPGDRDVSYGSTTGPFVAIRVHGPVRESGVSDTVYVNVVTANEIATAFGWTSPDDAAALEARLAHAQDHIRELEDELAEERSDKVVPLADVIDFVAERQARRPDTVAAE